MRVRATSLIKALAALILTAAAIGGTASSPSSASRPRQISDDDFQERYSPCHGYSLTGTLAEAFVRVTGWSRVVEVIGVREVNDLTDELELRARPLTGTDDATTIVSAHSSFTDGLRFGLETEGATVVIATEPGLGAHDVLFAVLILLDDGRILAPGECVMQMLGLATDVPAELRSANVERLRSVIGLTGDDAAAVFAQADGTQTVAAPSAPEQIAPGLNDERLRSAGAPLVEVIVTWPDSWTDSGDILCFQTAYGWGQCLSLTAGPAETGWSVYVNPTEPWLRVWKTRATARFDLEATQVADIADALPADQMTLVVLNLADSGSTVAAESPTTCPRSETLPICADETEASTGSITTEEVAYVVQIGDSLNSISQRFAVSIADLCAANDWGDCNTHVLLPDDTVVIPSGANLPVDEEGIPLCDNDTRRPSRTLVDGDTPASVAAILGLSLDELASANAGNPAYAAFVVGSVIWGRC